MYTSTVSAYEIDKRFEPRGTNGNDRSAQIRNVSEKPDVSDGLTEAYVNIEFSTQENSQAIA